MALAGLTKSRLHDRTTTAQSGRRLHAQLHAYRSLSLKFNITYFFVFNRLLLDIAYFQQCTFYFLLFTNFIKF